MQKYVSVHTATHVKIKGGRIERIVSKWGITETGGLNAPSKGGFGVITETGQRVDMYNASYYLKEE
jgi:hypothetical protein